MTYVVYCDTRVVLSCTLAGSLAYAVDALAYMCIMRTKLTTHSALRLVYCRCSQISTDLCTAVQAYTCLKRWTFDIDEALQKGVNCFGSYSRLYASDPREDKGRHSTQ